MLKIVFHGPLPTPEKNQQFDNGEHKFFSARIQASALADESEEFHDLPEALDNV